MSLSFGKSLIKAHKGYELHLKKRNNKTR